MVRPDGLSLASRGKAGPVNGLSLASLGRLQGATVPLQTQLILTTRTASGDGATRSGGVG